MKFSIFFLSILITISSCKEKPQTTTDLYNTSDIPSSNPDDVIKGFHKLLITYSGDNQHSAESKYKYQHKEEMSKSLEIVEKVAVPSLEAMIVFYRYSIGTDVIRRTQWLKKLDGKWYTYNKYFSQYDENPFQDGKADEAKKLLERASKWEKESSQVWWN